MLKTLDKKFMRELGLNQFVWATTSLGIIVAVFLMSIVEFGISSEVTWGMLGTLIIIHAVAHLLSRKNKPLASILLFVGSMLLINIIGWNCPVENGLVYTYPLLAISAIISLKKEKGLFPIFVFGVVSYISYMLIESPDPLGSLTVFDPILNFSISVICLALAILNIWLFSYKWKLKEQLVSSRYQKLNTFVKFVNESPLSLLRVDEQGEVLLMNNSARKLLKCTKGQRVHFPPGVSQAIMNALEDGKTVEMKTKTHGTDVLFTITPNFEERYVNIYGEDISEIQSVNDKLNELNNAMNLSADGIAIFSKDGVLQYVNQSFCGILGYQQTDELEDSKWENVCEKDWHKKFSSSIAPKLNIEHVWRGEAKSVKSNGDVLDTYLTLTRIPEGKTICYLRDNTEIKAFQDQLIVAKEKAEGATKAKSDFLATMSHEIRTPMNGVLGMATLMVGTDLDDIQKDYLDTILHSGENLMSIINEILDFSKIEAGKMELDEQKVSSKKLVHNALKLSSHKASVRNNTLVSQIAAGVPRFVLVDRGRVSQILNNLLSNAIKFTKSGKVELMISAVKTDVDFEHEITFAVRDTGIGIPQDKIESLFDPFVQADSSTTRRFGGTGLGLAICQRLAHLMGGNITIESEVGKGSTFYFKFKTLAIPGDESEEIEPKFILPDPALGNKHPLRILIAEDNYINQKLAEHVFSQMGYDITMVENGKLALEAAKKQKFDVIFMDLHMPEMDGLEATQQIREQLNDPPYIVALTANVVTESRSTCIEAGMCDFIQKPFKPSDIERVIRWVGTELENQSQNEELS